MVHVTHKQVFMEFLVLSTISSLTATIRVPGALLDFQKTQPINHNLKKNQDQFVSKFTMS